MPQRNQNQATAGTPKTARRRRDYAEAGRAQRQALERAAAAGCSAAELATLAGVFSWTTSWSRLTDHVSTGQIAVTIGLWPGEARDCPKHIRRKIALRLHALHDAGAIVYEPGGTKGQGSASTITVPEVLGDPTGMPLGDPTEVPQGGSHRDAPNAIWGTPNGRLGDPSRALGGPQNGTSGIPQGSPPGEYSGENPRGVLRSDERRQLIDRLTAATTDDEADADSQLEILETIAGFDEINSWIDAMEQRDPPGTRPRHLMDPMAQAIAEILGRTPRDWREQCDQAMDIAEEIALKHNPTLDEQVYLADHFRWAKPYGRQETIDSADIALRNYRDGNPSPAPRHTWTVAAATNA